MAHRIYTYNIDSTTKDQYPHYLGEWNYEIPELLIPLFSGNPRLAGKILYFDKEYGIAKLRMFYQLLADHYELQHKKDYDESVTAMFDLLERLPYDTLMLDAEDVFNMNEENHQDQAKEWMQEIQEKNILYSKAIEEQDITSLEKAFFSPQGYDSLLSLLKTDWINYGLGYWNEELYKNSSTAFEENGLWGLKDQNGQILAPAVYEDIFDFSDEGVAIAQKDGRFGYLRNDGKLAVECIYEQAFNTLLIEKEDFGIVQMDEKYGLVDIGTGTLVIPCEYDDLELLMYKGLFNAEKEGNYRVIDCFNQQMVAEYSDTPFDYEYPDLIFRMQKGTSKRAYYTLEGFYLGEYPEGTVLPIADGYYWVEPNKFQKKISIIRPDGSLLDEEVDKLIVLRDYGYASFAYRKDKQWSIFDAYNEEFRLENYTLTHIQVGGFYHLMTDVFVVSDQNLTGLYEAVENHWLLPLSENHLKIEICSQEIFRIITPRGMYYYDQKTDTRSDIYDYICEGIGDQEVLLCLFKGSEMLILDENRKVHKVSDFGIEALYEKKYDLRGKDQKYFLDFYRSRKNDLGK